MEIHLYQI